MNIFFDLDGTLLDSKPRLYQLFQHLVSESELSFDEYWDLKKNKIGHKEILRTKFLYSDKDVFSFEKAWMEKIEKLEWLALDHPFEGITDYLTELGKHHSLYLVTARQFEQIAIEQITTFGWNKIFKMILVTGQKKEKYELINTSVFVSKEDWFIGDTGKDIQTGKRLGINTAAVLTGFLSKEKLEEYAPDIIAGGVPELGHFVNT
ncbi:HAD family hydrolase [Pedobacter nutrimenti]|uniref:HAD family hydrolase n=1 Tax=Pedobacter nutrimenti TaxID=1241337 RepID=UPI00292DE75B|nr:HAD hydrolase-like protein [Pedobacter nutrimenti]